MKLLHVLVVGLLVLGLCRANGDAMDEPVEVAVEDATDGEYKNAETAIEDTPVDTTVKPAIEQTDIKVDGDEIASNTDQPSGEEVAVPQVEPLQEDFLQDQGIPQLDHDTAASYKEAGEEEAGQKAAEQEEKTRREAEELQLAQEKERKLVQKAQEQEQQAAEALKKAQEEKKKLKEEEAKSKKAAEEAKRLAREQKRKEEEERERKRKEEQRAKRRKEEEEARKQAELKAKQKREERQKREKEEKEKAKKEQLEKEARKVEKERIQKEKLDKAKKESELAKKESSEIKNVQNQTKETKDSKSPKLEQAKVAIEADEMTFEIPTQDESYNIIRSSTEGLQNVADAEMVSINMHNKGVDTNVAASESTISSWYLPKRFPVIEGQTSTVYVLDHAYSFIISMLVGSKAIFVIFLLMLSLSLMINLGRFIGWLLGSDEITTDRVKRFFTIIKSTLETGAQTLRKQSALQTPTGAGSSKTTEPATRTATKDGNSGSIQATVKTLDQVADLIKKFSLDMKQAGEALHRIDGEHN